MIKPPAHIAWMVDAVGEDSALRFIESAAGQRLTIPRKAAGSRLAEVYGDDVASVICDRYGGDFYIVPMCKTWRIKLYARMGLTVNEMAARAGISFVAVHQKLASGDGRPERIRPKDERQTSLF
ncbi:hypothetical protein [Acetobacter fallax]|uniref:Mor transcription activator domain-containing protein n=1 Tax=Acetobacter fallax TaxID=1737473 RepID=A0ABX0KA78_9PROT|nr:hypothetical protein [Acetobacter fallax]NHO33310.1 hypothetical protein [Acetobacter fallax]NHO36931.1 hypothetical protein [Acetobacter fallax]